jgi:SAM-dependent methyltransferase
MILTDIAAKSEVGLSRPTVLDIGCGHGFDNDSALQKSLAANAGSYIGVEPDDNIELQPIFSDVYRCFFEDASIPENSVDIAFAVMVLEHILHPQAFWDKLYTVLRKDGVFWALTVDSQHWFVAASLLMERLHLKDWYLRLLHRQKHYENYRTYYRSNSLAQVRQLARSFNQLQTTSLGWKGQVDYYIPHRLRPIGRRADWLLSRQGKVGVNLLIRVVK